jgi:hypothetical protein
VEIAAYAINNAFAAFYDGKQAGAYTYIDGAWAYTAR